MARELEQLARAMAYQHNILEEYQWTGRLQTGNQS